MIINCKKSFCLRVGQRCDAVCANVVNYCGQSISWVTEIRYLGIYFASSRSLKCTLDMAKRSFYRTANAIGLLNLDVDVEQVQRIIIKFLFRCRN